MSSADIIYRINDQDEMVYVNEAWETFATANDGGAATSPHVLYQSLWNFIVDSATQEIYRQMLQQVRNGRPITFSFRCDSPTQRRLLEMQVTGDASGTVEFKTRTLNESSHKKLTFSKTNTPPFGNLLWMCGWCKKVLVGKAWVEADEAVVMLRLLETSPLPPLTYGMCEGCYLRMTKTVETDRPYTSTPGH